LFPEKCDFQFGMVPKSGNYKIESLDDGSALGFSIGWVNPDNQAFHSQYEVIPDGRMHPFGDQQIADALSASIDNSSIIQCVFYKSGKPVLTVRHEIMPNGYLRITHQGFEPGGHAFINTEIYHKQMNVLPYASSVGSVAIRPTEAGMIKHKALSAMEEQTNMQLDQIREQIELLARQAQEIQKRKELSWMIYEAKLKFQTTDRASLSSLRKKRPYPCLIHGISAGMGWIRPFSSICSHG